MKAACGYLSKDDAGFLFHDYSPQSISGTDIKYSVFRNSNKLKSTKGGV